MMTDEGRIDGFNVANGDGQWATGRAGSQVPILRSSVMVFAPPLPRRLTSTSRGGETNKEYRMVRADDIPVAHTPAGFWRGEMPAPVLALCDEPLAAGATDIRGLWRAFAVEVNGQPVDDTRHIERIEQCGNRVVITAGGVVHDMRADGTLKHGVNDIAARSGQPIAVAASFEDGKLVLRPFGGPVAVTRELDGDVLVWKLLPLARVTRMRRVE